MFDRLEKLIGKENLYKIKDSKVILIGVGGVGGTCLETLVRSGFINVTVVDHDVFELSNLNRQILSNINVIGTNKVTVAVNRANLINPSIKIIGKNIFLDESNIELLKDFDYVIDACDSTNTKISIMNYCHSNNIKLISCMGMGNKTDPSKVLITKLSKTEYDPLAKKIRTILRKNKINYDPVVVSSIESPKKGLNIISSSMIVPSTAGLYLAYYVINDIIKK